MRRLEDYPLDQMFQLRARWERLVDILSKTGRIHPCELEEPHGAEWSGPVLARFSYPGVTYFYNMDANTAGEVRDGYLWNYDGEGAVMWMTRNVPVGKDWPLGIVREQEPTPNPDRN